MAVHWPSNFIRRDPKNEVGSCEKVYYDFLENDKLQWSRTTTQSLKWRAKSLRKIILQQRFSICAILPISRPPYYDLAKQCWHEVKHNTVTYLEQRSKVENNKRTIQEHAILLLNCREGALSFKMFMKILQFI